MTSLSYLQSLDNEWIEMTLGLKEEDEFVCVITIRSNGLTPVIAIYPFSYHYQSDALNELP